MIMSDKSPCKRGPSVKLRRAHRAAPREDRKNKSVARARKEKCQTSPYRCLIWLLRFRRNAAVSLFPLALTSFSLVQGANGAGAALTSLTRRVRIVRDRTSGNVFQTEPKSPLMHRTITTYRLPAFIRQDANRPMLSSERTVK
jgi:hypothetical protein